MLECIEKLWNWHFHVVLLCPILLVFALLCLYALEKISV